MENPGVQTDDGYFDISMPRGGPIYVPNLVSPFTSVLSFQDYVVQELQNLKAEISPDPSQPCPEDLSVDELKIFSEEELVNEALKVSFKDGAVDQCASPNSANNLDVEVDYFPEVEYLVKIKQKQDEDKAAARLHSFHGSCKSVESTITLLEKKETIKFLNSTCSKAKVKSSNIQHIPVSHPETILYVEVFHNKQIKGKSQEFLVLGRQLLTDLRDNIDCMTDEVMRRAGQYDPSGYFLIEDVFYNDLRDPSAIDYSNPIFEWLENSKDEALEKWQCIQSGHFNEKHKKMFGDVRVPNLPRFKSLDMHKTHFFDLKFQLGAGYLYCHQGDCQHMIVIRDMRLIHVEDVNNLAAYPVMTFQHKQHAQKCSVCKIYRAKKVTVNDKFARDNPCYFCEKCYFLLHYSHDHSLLYTDFQVYDYLFS